MATATNYFNLFNKVLYENRIGVNILNRAKLVTIKSISNSTLFTPYIIQEGERPEDIAETYYGSTTYFWIVLLANNITNVFEDWPKTESVLYEYILQKYGSIEYATSTAHHYETADGIYVNDSRMISTSLVNDITDSLDYWDGTTSKKITYFDYETNLNDKKKIINLIKAEYKNQLVKELQNLFR